MPRRPRPRAPRSEDHAHEGPRAARRGGIRAPGDVRLLEGARSPSRFSRNISPKTISGTPEKKPKSTRASSRSSTRSRNSPKNRRCLRRSSPSRASTARDATRLKQNGGARKPKSCRRHRAWKRSGPVADFGALRPAAPLTKPAISVASHLKPAAHTSKHASKPVPKPPEKAHTKPPG